MSEGPIYWHPGLFLQPQHFQILQQRMTDAITPVATHMAPYFWGVASLSVNEGALAAGRLEIAGIELIFPTATEMIAYPGNAVCTGRHIANDAIAVDGEITVYVGLKTLKPGEANVTEATSQEEMATAPTRMVVPLEPELVPDSYGTAPPAQVRRMAYVLTLVFENELDQAGDLDLMPLARLKREADRITLDAAFVPPCLTLSASSVLTAMLREIRDRVQGKARQLEGYKNLSVGQPASGDFTLLLMGLRTLSRFTARLDHAVAAPCLSPWDAYGMLKEAVAELSVFSLNISVLGEDWQDEKLLPDYDHTRQGTCFRKACDLIIRLLEGISAGPRFVTRFQFNDPYWTAEIPTRVLAEARTSGGSFWLVLHSESITPEAIADAVERRLKLSSPDGMKSLLVRALPGIPLALSESPPPGMPRMKGALYFRIGQESPLWAEVEKNGKICLHWTDAPQDLDAQLALLAR